MGKQLDLGNGLRITESEDMGIFIHYKSKSGHECGQSMGNTDDTMGHRWAVELLEDGEQEKPQRQDSTLDQMRDLLAVANKLGMYDAVDLIKYKCS